MSVCAKTFAALVAASVAVGGTAWAQSVESTVKARSDLMREMAEFNKTLVAASKGGPLNAEVAKAAEGIANDMPKIPALFPAGTGPDRHPTTRARPEIWTALDKFQAYAKQGQTQFAAVAAAARSGDAAAFNAAYKQADDTCVACHREFRGPRR